MNHMDYDVVVTKKTTNEMLVNATMSREGLDRTLGVYVDVHHRDLHEFMRKLNQVGINTTETDGYSVTVTKIEPSKIDWREIARDWANHWYSWDGASETYAMMLDKFWEPRGGMERYFHNHEGPRPVQRTHFE